VEENRVIIEITRFSLRFKGRQHKNKLKKLSWKAEKQAGNQRFSEHLQTENAN